MIGLKKQVLGFLFDEELKYVALIRKNRPEWMKDKFNGIGGKVEEGETFDAAMIREFFEETGVTLKDWIYDRTYVFMEYKSMLQVFSAKSNKIFEVKTTTDEEIFIIPLEELKNFPIIENVEWMIKDCLSKFKVSN